LGQNSCPRGHSETGQKSACLIAWGDIERIPANVMDPALVKSNVDYGDTHPRSVESMRTPKGNLSVTLRSPVRLARRAVRWVPHNVPLQPGRHQLSTCSHGTPLP
jgi:hypothetical protein